MGNRTEITTSLKVLSISLVLLCVGCSKLTDSELNLKCQGKYIHTFNEDGKQKRTEEPWVGFISFKDKRRYSIERKEYLSDKCQVWTDEEIKCLYEKDESKEFKYLFKSNYVINRITGQFYSEYDLNGDESYYTGSCEKLKVRRYKNLS